MADFQDNLDEAATVVELRSAVTRLASQLQAQEHKNSELVDAVYRAVRDASTGLNIPAVPAAKVASLPDWQRVGFHGV